MTKNKKILYSIALTVFVSAFLSTNYHSALVEAEVAQGAYYRGEYLFTTYYPSPYGSYAQLHVYNDLNSKIILETPADILNYHNQIVFTAAGNDKFNMGSVRSASDTTFQINSNTNIGLVINSLGNVGIGTTNPGAKLDIKGTDNIVQMIIKASALQTDANPLIQMQDSAGSEIMRIHADSGSSIFLGKNAGMSNTPGNNPWNGNNYGYYNVALGSYALSSNTYGTYNTAVGYDALMSNIGKMDGSTGFSNTAIGYRALASCTAGYMNVAIGHGALEANNGMYNIAIGGYGTLSKHTAGVRNIAIGTFALENSTGGGSNIAIGANTLGASINASDNLAIGTFAGIASTGKNNVFLGSQSGYKNTGSGNVFLGYQSGYNEVAGSNKLYIANSSAATPLIYGDFSTGRVGLGTTNPQRTLHIKDVMRLEPQSSAPTGPSEGDIYVNSSDHHMYCYLNGVWKQLDL